MTEKSSFFYARACERCELMLPTSLDWIHQRHSYYLVLFLSACLQGAEGFTPGLALWEEMSINPAVMPPGRMLFTYLLFQLFHKFLTVHAYHAPTSAPTGSTANPREYTPSI